MPERGGGHFDQGPGRGPAGAREELLSKATRELMDAAAAAAEKIVLGAQQDPYGQFLDLAEKGGAHEQSQ